MSLTTLLRLTARRAEDGLMSLEQLGEHRQKILFDSNQFRERLDNLG